MYILDPLITQIAKTYKGYNLEVSWTTDLKTKKTNQLQISTSVLAFMDDTLWIASSKNELEQILELASSFFKMANLKINPLKSILSTNSKNLSSINFIQQTISPQSKNTPFKFLGCWFLPSYQQTQQVKLITQESQNLINILKTKQITDKQTAYIINTVIIPTLEYRIHNIVLSKTTCDQILSTYLTTAKYKSNLSRSILNSVMLNHNIYGIKNI